MIHETSGTPQWLLSYDIYVSSTLMIHETSGTPQWLLSYDIYVSSTLMIHECVNPILIFLSRKLLACLDVLTSMH